MRLQLREAHGPVDGHRVADDMEVVFTEVHDPSSVSVADESVSNIPFFRDGPVNISDDAMTDDRIVAALPYGKTQSLSLAEFTDQKLDELSRGRLVTNHGKQDRKAFYQPVSISVDESQQPRCIGFLITREMNPVGPQHCLYGRPSLDHVLS